MSKIEEEEEEEEENLLVGEIEEEDAKVEEEPSDTDDKEVCACHLEHLGISDNHILEIFLSHTIQISWY